MKTETVGNLQIQGLFKEIPSFYLGMLLEHKDMGLNEVVIPFYYYEDTANSDLLGYGNQGFQELNLRNYYETTKIRNFIVVEK